MKGLLRHSESRIDARWILANAASLIGGVLLIASGCSEKSTLTQTQHTPASPQITEIVSYTSAGSCGYTGAVCLVPEHHPVTGNTISLIPVPCGPDFRIDIKVSGGQYPLTLTASGLPAGMALIENQTLDISLPCSAAGQTLTAALTVTDSLGRKSPAITVSFLVQGLQASATNISGAWAGTFVSSHDADCDTTPVPAAATFLQNGELVSGSLLRPSGGCGVDASFHGTLKGNSLSGSLTETVTSGSSSRVFSGSLGGTASDSAIEIAISDLQAGNTAIGTAGKMSLHR